MRRMKKLKIFLGFSEKLPHFLWFFDNQIAVFGIIGRNLGFNDCYKI